AHEAAHLANRDLRWVAQTRALLVALWAHPLFWLVRRRLRLDQEALADAAAADVTSRQAYAEQLVALARDVRGRPTMRLSSAVGLWEGRAQLRRRIAILLDERLTVLRNCSSRLKFAAVSMILAGAIAFSFFTLQPGIGAAAESEQSSSEKSEKSLEYK